MGDLLSTCILKPELKYYQRFDDNNVKELSSID